MDNAFASHVGVGQSACFCLDSAMLSAVEPRSRLSKRCQGPPVPRPGRFGRVAWRWSRCRGRDMTGLGGEVPKTDLVAARCVRAARMLDPKTVRPAAAQPECQTRVRTTGIVDRYFSERAILASRTRMPLLCSP